jgi:hypothetical protein
MGSSSGFEVGLLATKRDSKERGGEEHSGEAEGRVRGPWSRGESYQNIVSGGGEAMIPDMPRFRSGERLRERRTSRGQSVPYIYLCFNFELMDVA